MPDSIIKFNNISYKYSSGTVALNNINLDITKSKKSVLLGANGAGKSTLMLLLNGILKPTSGTLLFNNQIYSYKRSKIRDIRKSIGVLFQDSDSQLIAPSVYEEITFGLCNISKDKLWIKNQADMVIDSFRLDDIIDKPPHQLSDGQKKRVCLAAIVAMEPEVIVCDEPASNLDPQSAEMMFNYLDKLNRQGKTVIISTHDVNHAFEWANSVIVMNSGKVAAKGTPTEVFSDKELINRCGLKVPTIIEICNKLGINSYPENIDMLIKQLKN